MLTLLDDDSSSESEAGDIDDLLSSHEDLLSKCPTYEVRARSRPSHASTLPLTPFSLTHSTCPTPSLARTAASRA